MKERAELVRFESVDIRVLADEELDDIVGGSIFEGKLGIVQPPIVRPPGLP